MASLQQSSNDYPAEELAEVLDVVKAAATHTTAVERRRFAQLAREFIVSGHPIAQSIKTDMW